MSPGFTWNLVNDLQEMWSLPSMVNAFRAGAIVAVLAGVVGWFMVLRRADLRRAHHRGGRLPGRRGRVLLGVSATSATSGSASARRW